MANGRVVYMNGELVDESEAKVSIYDSALMFGDMVFEMTRSFAGKQFKLREHLERLYASADYVEIDMPISIEEMESAVNETIKANTLIFDKNDEHRLMINVSRGALGIYQDVVDVHKGTNIIISDFPLCWTVASMGPLFDSGINAMVPSQRAIPAHLLEPKIKNRSRLHYLMANIEVSKIKGENNWALLLDPDGFVTEGTGSNFFIVTKAGKILTPEPRNILRGISRDYIFELAKQLNMKCIERNIEIYDVMNAQEAFMTATPFCMLPVTSINNHAIGDGLPGKITGALLDAWGKNVGVNIVEQIKSYSGGVSPASNPTPYKFNGK